MLQFMQKGGGPLPAQRALQSCSDLHHASHFPSELQISQDLSPNDCTAWDPSPTRVFLAPRVLDAFCQAAVQGAGATAEAAPRQQCLGSVTLRSIAQPDPVGCCAAL